MTQQLFETVYEALKNKSFTKLGEKLTNVHPADIADIYEDLSAKYRMQLLDITPEKIDAKVLQFLESSYKNEVVKYLGIDHFEKSLRELSSEDIIELSETLDPREKSQLISITSKTHNEITSVLEKYNKDSIGRNMTLDFIAVPHSWTVDKTISHIKLQNKSSEDYSEIFIVNELLNPIGVITIANLICADRNLLIDKIASHNILTINADLDKEKAYDLFSKYHFAYIPVVENSGRIVGVLKADDILKIIEDETTEDYLRLGGVFEASISDNFWNSSLRRLQWLVISLLNALFSPLIINLFQNSIQQVISLAVLMPIVSSIGGNIGMQTVSVVVKAFSSNQLREKQFIKIALKEAAIGSINGLILGILLGILTGIHFNNAALGVVLAASMLFCATWGAFAGAVLPILFEKLGYDAALCSAPLVTMMMDISGYSIFLGLATLFMKSIS